MIERLIICSKLSHFYVLRPKTVQLSPFYVLRPKTVRFPNQKHTVYEPKPYVFGTETIKGYYLHREYNPNVNATFFPTPCETLSSAS